MRTLVLTLLLLPIWASADVLAQDVALSAKEGVRLHEVPYGIPQVPWDARLGRHRACVRIGQAADAVRVLVPWRRRDHDAAQKNVIIIDAATRQLVKNLVPVHIGREYGILVFQPETAPGEYHVYYLPCPAPQRNKYHYQWNYDPPESTANPAWIDQCGLTADQLAKGSWRQLPEAKTFRFEARTKHDSFYPMEVVATAAETRQLLAQHTEPYLLFPEDRRHPIRMTDDLPLRWIKSGPGTSVRGEAQRNEFYAFQIGVYATNHDLEDIDVHFSELRAGRAGRSIPASLIRCLNTGGVNWDGQPFRKTVHVPKGRVQPLWIGVQVPQDADPGDYEGSVVVKPKNAGAQRVAVSITVLPSVLQDHGDGETWRHARLRWLDSTIGMDDEVVAPYTPLKLNGRTVRCLGREIRFGGSGLFESIRSGGREILAGPMRFVIETDAGPVILAGGKPEIVKQAPGAIEWQSEASGEAISLLCRARMECDGHANFKLRVKSRGTIRVKDIRLEIVVRRETSKYFMGIGRQGGLRPEEHTWKWQGPYDSFWIGDVHAGLHCELRGGSYHGPLIAKYRPAPPPSWWNAGHGGCTVRNAGQNQAIIHAFTGPRELKPGQELEFEFSLLITPVKPLATSVHFRQRYHHSVAIDQRVVNAGANIINVHHANEINPYINYPFIAVDRMREFVEKWHNHDMKVKIYYTVRELSNYAVELWALRSLGHEVFADGDEGGFPWLREHLASGYRPRWFTLLADGTSDASISMSGASRWYNYYIEGLAWLLENIKIDGLYLDDVAFDRVTLKRMRKVMERIRPGCLIDLHSNTAFSFGPSNQYAEFFPYVDSVWFGEGFKFNEMSPDTWLVEASGIPFGLMGEILAQHGYSPWQGMIFGMSCRGVNPLWTLWDDFGIDESKMTGYWEPDCPVRTNHADVLTTVYAKKGEALVAVASWARDQERIRLTINWSKLGLDPDKASLRAPVIDGMQDAKKLGLSDDILVAPLGGYLLLIEQAGDPD